MSFSLLISKAGFVHPQLTTCQFREFVVNYGPAVNIYQNAEFLALFSGKLLNDQELSQSFQNSSCGPAELLYKLYSHGFQIGTIVKGTFVFVLIDEFQMRVFNDKMGTMPVYYFTKDGKVTVTNQAKLLIPFPEIDLRLKPLSELKDNVETNFCVFESIEKLKPGYQLVDGVPQKNPVIQNGVVKFEAEYKSSLEQKLTSAVRQSVRESNEVSTLLSGGVDSSLISALASKTVKILNTVSMGSTSSNEFEWADIVANHLGSRHCELVLSDEHILDGILEAVYENEIFDWKAAEIHAPMSSMYRSVKGSKVLTGYGADLLFGGILDPKCDLALGAETLVNEINRTTWTHEFSIFLADKYGVALEHPFWNSDVIDFALHLPMEYKIRGGEVKVLLRNVALNHLPQVTAMRPKIGIHQASKINDIFGDLLKSRGVSKQEFVYRLFQDLFEKRIPYDQVYHRMNHAYVLKELTDGVLVITMNHPNHLNPFCLELESAIKHSLVEADGDDQVKAVVVYGGKNRSFSAGGDFCEVKTYKGGDEVDRWINRIVSLYKAPLVFSKPVVAAVDGYAIGMGLQFALTFDCRVGSQEAVFTMPELKNGVSCIFGSAMLELCVGRSTMQKIVYGCQSMNSEEALKVGVIHQIAGKDGLLEESVKIAKQLGEYPAVPFRNTKVFTNKHFIERLDGIAEDSKKAHRESFQAGSSTSHIKNILKKKF